MGNLASSTKDYLVYFSCHRGHVARHVSILYQEKGKQFPISGSAVFPGISELLGQTQNCFCRNMCEWCQLAAGECFVGHQVAKEPPHPATQVSSERSREVGEKEVES